MLLDRTTLDRIARRDVSLAFRRWRRPTVKSGGTLMTALGQLQIRSVTAIEIGSITEIDAQRAGYSSREALVVALSHHAEGTLYRIELGEMLPDPRVALRQEPLDSRQSDEIRSRLDRLDAASPDGPWTLKTLRVIRDHPALRAGDLCRLVGQERDRFKPNVRKLKTLGLTISLEVGYRLSPRGEAYLRERESH